MTDDPKRDQGASGAGGTGQPARVPGREPRALPKRFYKAVAVAAGDGGYAVLLDGRPVRTPAKSPLRVASEALATAIAGEWEAQEKEIRPATMPLTTLACSAIDAVTAKKADVAAEIARYAESDLICYRAEGPRELVERQEAGWDPVVAWAAKVLGVPFRCTGGLMAVEQSPKVAPAVLQVLAPLGPLRLAAMHVLTTLTGSAILALAILRGRLGVEEAWRLAQIDEDWQIEQWGVDREAQERTAARLKMARAAATALALAQASE